MIFFLNVLPFRKSGESDHYKRLLSANYLFIKRACSLTVKWHGGRTDDAAADEAEYLLGRALEHFMEDDYRRLRGGEIKNVKSFFRGCIENLFRDILAERHGKDRGKERAREFGTLGERIHGLLKSGYSIDAIHGLLSQQGLATAWEEIYRIVQRINGSNALPPTDCNRVVQGAAEEGDEPDPSVFEVIDNRENPEERVAEKRKYQLRQRVLQDLDSLLDAEGKVLVRLYYLEQEQKRTVADIASYLGKTPKAADNKLRRILAGFREYMMKKGLTPEDIL